MKKSIVALLSLVMGTTLATPMMASAFEVEIGGHHFSDRGVRSNHQYAVFYRKYRHDAWKLKDFYGSRFEAEYSLRKLQDRGYLAYIERR
jgi:hypothetical protein